METMPFEQAVLIFAQLHRGRCFERLTELRNACLHTDSYDLQDFTESLVENDGGPGSGNFGHSGRPGRQAATRFPNRYSRKALTIRSICLTAKMISYERT